MYQLVEFKYFEHTKAPHTKLESFFEAKQWALEEGKNKGLDKYDTGDKDTSGLAGTSIRCFSHPDWRFVGAGRHVLLLRLSPHPVDARPSNNGFSMTKSILLLIQNTGLGILSSIQIKPGPKSPNFL